MMYEIESKENVSKEKEKEKPKSMNVNVIVEKFESIIKQ